MSKVTILNAVVFNGEKFAPLESVTIQDGKIGYDESGSLEIDASGCTLMPSLIDSHVHLYNEDNLRESAKHGVTTLLDMGSRSPTVIDSLRNKDGLPDVLSAFSPAFAPRSALFLAMDFPQSSVVVDIGDAARFVDEQISYGADYIKVILENGEVQGQTPFPVEILAAITANAHDKGKKVIAHSVSQASYELAANNGVDVITHVPFAMPLPKETISLLSNNGSRLVPTMATMKGIVDAIKRRNPYIPFDYGFVRQSVAAMHNAGVPIFAGSDANTNDPTTPYSAPYGITLLEELELMVDAGLSITEALRSATSSPADYWGLNDRGRIAAGKRADLLLLEGDLSKGVGVIRNIKQVWIAGQPFLK
ncbi:MAG: amidohydrolase family protein [Clostridiales bacterium]|jgi:imidazolonepropionase-like amidohydrolase|nr:amidohydrolase family protein [Clostridiales bacterium]